MKSNMDKLHKHANRRPLCHVQDYGVNTLKYPPFWHLRPRSDTENISRSLLDRNSVIFGEISLLAGRTFRHITLWK